MVKCRLPVCNGFSVFWLESGEEIRLKVYFWVKGTVLALQKSSVHGFRSFQVDSLMISSCFILSVHKGVPSVICEISIFAASKPMS